MYSDPSSANQASTFTINRRLVSCGVGAENLAGIGRFEMLMYSTQIKRYAIDSDRKEITARGEMRSIDVPWSFLLDKRTSCPSPRQRRK